MLRRWLGSIWKTGWKPERADRKESEQATAVVQDEDLKWSSEIRKYVCESQCKERINISWRLCLQEGMEKKGRFGVCLWKKEKREEAGTEVRWLAQFRGWLGLNRQQVELIIKQCKWRAWALEGSWITEISFRVNGAGYTWNYGNEYELWEEYVEREKKQRDQACGKLKCTR